MICEKTGCIIHLVPAGIFLRGDAFRIGEFCDDMRVGEHAIIVRAVLASRSREPIGPIHYTVYDYTWWDEGARISTIVSTEFDWHGYEGKATV